MSCPLICSREAVSCDVASPGPVGSNELILRALFPSDKGAKGIKRSVIPPSQLWAGQISVWRLSALVGLSLNQLLAVLEPRLIRGNGEKFDELRGTPASTIRELTANGSSRSVCLLDECTIDAQGNKHPAHAHIALCEIVKGTIVNGAERSYRDDDTFIAIQEGLKSLIELTPRVWQHPN
jgi:hypothetical protein